MKPFTVTRGILALSTLCRRHSRPAARRHASRRPGAGRSSGECPDLRFPGQEAAGAQGEELRQAQGREEGREEQGRRRRARLDGHVLPRRRLQPRGADARRHRRVGDDRLHRQREPARPPRSHPRARQARRQLVEQPPALRHARQHERQDQVEDARAISRRWTPPIPRRSSGSSPSGCRTSPPSTTPWCSATTAAPGWGCSTTTPTTRPGCGSPRSSTAWRRSRRPEPRSSTSSPSTCASWPRSR